MYPDLIDMSAPAHAFAMKNDLVTCQYVDNQFEKRAANIIAQYCINSGKKNWAKLDVKTLKFHWYEDQLPSNQETEDVQSLQNDLAEWEAAHANLEAEKKILIDEMQNTILNMANELKKLTANWRSALKALRKRRDLHTGGN